MLIHIQLSVTCADSLKIFLYKMDELARCPLISELFKQFDEGDKELIRDNCLLKKLNKYNYRDILSKVKYVDSIGRDFIYMKRQKDMLTEDDANQINSYWINLGHPEILYYGEEYASYGECCSVCWDDFIPSKWNLSEILKKDDVESFNSMLRDVKTCTDEFQRALLELCVEYFANKCFRLLYNKFDDKQSSGVLRTVIEYGNFEIIHILEQYANLGDYLFVAILYCQFEIAEYIMMNSVGWIKDLAYYGNFHYKDEDAAVNDLMRRYESSHGMTVEE